MKSNKFTILFLSFWLVLLAVYLLLLIPDVDIKVDPVAENRPFAWDQDSLWNKLEQIYQGARTQPLDSLDQKIRSFIYLLNTLEYSMSVTYLDDYAFLRDTTTYPDSTKFMTVEDQLDLFEQVMFKTAPLITIHAKWYEHYNRTLTVMRRIVKKLSAGWDVDDQKIRDRLYRLLYGSRATLEEIILQRQDTSTIFIDYQDNEPNKATPNLGQLTVKSGDILLSRGGAPTSALIARGNDYPGNFSHVALVHVDSVSGQVSIIESHIEIGVAVSTPEQYLKDKKLRILQLRLNDEFLSDSLVPYKAATYVLNRAKTEHIPYDFSMDYNDDCKLFCSEVASSAYRSQGIKLWMGISHISLPGLRSWLAAFGVKHFKTQEPSDLEYDPQLDLIAEWIDPHTLFKDHIDNAVIDIMLEDAEKGERLDYNIYYLPVARAMKAYSVIKNWFGSAGPIPEGMSATAALKNDAFSTKHQMIKSILNEKIDVFEKAAGYRPPYWQLVKLARQAKDEYDQNQ